MRFMLRDCFFKVFFAILFNLLLLLFRDVKYVLDSAVLEIRINQLSGNLCTSQYVENN